MKAPDKIYLAKSLSFPDKIHSQWYKEDVVGNGIEYIRKDALMEWLDKELDRLYELLPDASNENPSQMELRYLGQYMQTEILFDKINSL